MQNILKVIGINFLVLIIILSTLEFMSAFIFDLKDITFSLTNTNDSRANLVNYKNVNWAKKHFSETKEVNVEYSSYVGWKSQYFKGQTINIDSNGIRQTFPFYAPKVNSVNTMFLGGSTIWGYGVNDANTIPSLFSQIGNSKYSVSNLGEPGYSAFQSTVFLMKYLNIKNKKPDLIITYDGVNNSPTFLPKLFSHPKELGINLIMKGVEKRKKFRLINLPNRQEMLFKIKNKTISSFSNDKNSSIITDLRNKESAIELLDSWLNMKIICEANNVKFLCILQPNIYIGNPNTFNLNGFEYYPQFSKHSYNYYDNIFVLLESSKYESLKENFINLGNSLDNVENVYIDYCHLSPKGNLIIAEKILSHLKNTNF
jgi:hypothetical protein